MVQIFTDGAAQGNPGNAAIGIVLKDNEKNTTMHFSHFIGTYDTQQAEFIAVIYALKLAKQYHMTSIILHTDSKTVVDSIDKAYIKQPLYQPLLNEILNLLTEFDLFFIKWIARHENKNADHLAKQALHHCHLDQQIAQLPLL